MQIQNVTIDSEFFNRELDEYVDWHRAMIREAMQNSIDAKGSTQIRFHVEYQAGQDVTWLTWRNDGQPMDLQTLTGKLLCLGASGKRFENATGGFGKAKVILYFAHQHYRVFSGRHQVIGCGGNYVVGGIHDDLQLDTPHGKLQSRSELVPSTLTNTGSLMGTLSVVAIKGDQSEELRKQVRSLSGLTYWPGGSIYLDDEPLKLFGSLGRARAVKSFGKVYHIRLDSGKRQGMCVVRMRGIPMFIDRLDTDDFVVVELIRLADREQVLTANRDTLNYPYNRQLREFLQQISTSRSQAFKPRAPRRLEWQGSTLRSTAAKLPTRRRSANFQLGQVPQPSPASPETAIVADEPLMEATPTQPLPSTEQPMVASSDVFPIQFAVVNHTDSRLPGSYQPGRSNFSSYAARLIAAWTASVYAVHAVEKDFQPFTVGFLFDPEAEASVSGPGNGRAAEYLINPVDPTELTSKTIAAATKVYTTQFDRRRLLSIAAHEYTHLRTGSPHDERFSCFLTDLMGRLWTARTEVIRIIQDYEKVVYGLVNHTRQHASPNHRHGDRNLAQVSA